MEFIIIPAYANYPSLTTEAQSCRASQKAARSSLSLLSLMAQRKRSWRLCWSLQPSRPGELKWELFPFHISLIWPHFVMHLLKGNETKRYHRDENPRRSRSCDLSSMSEGQQNWSCDFYTPSCCKNSPDTPSSLQKVTIPHWLPEIISVRLLQLAGKRRKTNTEIKVWSNLYIVLLSASLCFWDAHLARRKWNTAFWRVWI